MEIASRNAAQQMQTRIREEFSYITHKRDREFQILKKGESGKRFKFMSLMGEIRRLDLQLEDFIEFFQLNKEERLKIAIIGLDDEAWR